MSEWIKIETKKQAEAALATNPNAWLDFINGSFTLDIKAGDINIRVAAGLDISVVARDSSRVVAWGSSSVEAWGSSSVVARGSSSVEAWGSSSVVARGSSSVVARDSSRVVARGSSSVEARGSSSVAARGSSRVVAWGSSSVEAWGSSSVVARDSSRVVARGSSRVEARDSSSVVAWDSSRVVAWDSSRVVARGSSSVEAWDSSSVVARDSSSVEARGNAFIRLFRATSVKFQASVVVIRHNNQIDCGPALVHDAIAPGTPQEWCDFYGVPVVDGIATLFKRVDSDYSTDRARPRGIFYRPGEMPSAPDWDGGEAECGGGLHFSPSPGHTRKFHSGPRVLACPIRLTDMAVHPRGDHPDKVKAALVCAPIYEVNEDGAPQ